jgi:hypothetical protein
MGSTVCVNKYGLLKNNNKKIETANHCIAKAATMALSHMETHDEICGWF